MVAIFIKAGTALGFVRVGNDEQADSDRHGIEPVGFAAGFDETNPYGRAKAQMASVFVEWERAMIRERTRAAMKVKRGRKERISAHASFGWEFGPVATLVENPAEQRNVA